MHRAPRIPQMVSHPRLAPVLVTAAVVLCVGVAAAEPPQDQPLGLREAVDTALRNHASVAIAGNQVRQAEAGLTVARARYRPQAAADWQYTFNDSRGGRRFATLGGVPMGVGGSQERHQSTLVTSFTLFDSGLRQARLDYARASLEGADATLGLARASLSYNVSTAYFNLLLARRALELARERVSQAQAHLELVQARIEAGLGARVDRFPFEAELAQAQLGRVSGENQVGQAAIALRNVMGLQAGPALETMEPPTIPDLEHLPLLNDAIAVAQGMRQDVLEARRATDAARASYSESEVSARPVLSINTTYTWKVEPAPSGRDLVVGAEATFPIFDAGARHAQAAAARVSLDSARLRLAQLEKDAAAQVAQARLAVTTAWERINAARVSVEAARQSLQSAEARYQAGLAIPIEITDAQVSYYNAQLDAASARYDYFASLAALRNAVGLPISDFADLAGSAVLTP